MILWSSRGSCRVPAGPMSKILFSFRTPLVSSGIREFRFQYASNSAACLDFSLQNLENSQWRRHASITITYSTKDQIARFAVTTEEFRNTFGIFKNVQI
ncbi:hypothetical protein TNCV_1012961 [Trichonephila clavipes]|uniref:Uncharacterized protein n=1 Tax=Trichonephila clavipes TaxID=2585209 RepID=A0A8X6VX84_TRICX|nr:hypothetical protein TNCV_1012961 [Trichonephila clavipes]